MQKLPDFRPNQAQIEVKLIVSNSRIKVDRDLILLPNDRYGVVVVSTTKFSEINLSMTQLQNIISQRLKVIETSNLF